MCSRDDDPTTRVDVLRRITLADAKRLPGLLGRIAPVMLAKHGEYGYRDAGGLRILLVLDRG